MVRRSFLFLVAVLTLSVWPVHLAFFASTRGLIVLPDYPLLSYAKGVATVLSAGDGRWPVHPILELIARGRAIHAEHEEKKASVTSLEAAVEDYVRAFGLDPPEGFDRW
jgi:hypothetical protein